MIILDTDVLSEMMRPEPATAVVAWLAAQPATSLFTTTVTQAEILYGLRLLPSTSRRSRLEIAVGEMFEIEFAGRVLPFDPAAARAYAEIAAARRRSGRPIAQFDAQIAAIRSRNASVATRNSADFDGCGVEVINPWGPRPAQG